MKRFSTRVFVACCASLLSGVLAAAQTPAQPSPPPAPQGPAELTVPAGFKVAVFASDVTNGRLMAVSPDGVLFVARQSKGDVVALPDRNRDGKADSVDVVAGDLARPHSVAFNGGYLYIATRSPFILTSCYSGSSLQPRKESSTRHDLNLSLRNTKAIICGS